MTAKSKGNTAQINKRENDKWFNFEYLKFLFLVKSTLIRWSEKGKRARPLSHLNNALK